MRPREARFACVMLEVVVMAVAWFNPAWAGQRATEKSYLKTGLRFRVRRGLGEKESS
jgi:hypothetical protein